MPFVRKNFVERFVFHPTIFASIVFCLLTQVIVPFPAYGQSIVQGPAFGNVSGGAIVSTGQFQGKTLLAPPPGQRLVNPHWDHFTPPLADDRLNNTPPAAPLRSNEFIDPAVSTPQTPIFDPPGVVIDFEGIPDRGTTIPPDPHLAVGPNHVIAVVNSEFVIFDKQGNQLFQAFADDWFQNVLPNSGAFDPVIVYDHFADRWVMVWDNEDGNSNTAFWLVSVSDDSDPMGDWCNYAFPAHLNGASNSFTWGDYEKVGYDYQAIYISANQFAFSDGFQYSKTRIIPKSQLYDMTCGPVDYTDFWDFRDPNNPGQRIFGPVIAATHLDSTDNKAYWVVDAPYFTSTFITLWTVEDPLGASPIVSAVNIPTAAAFAPPDANQLGGGSPRINSGGRKYRNAVYTDGSVWTATAVAGGTSFPYAFSRYVRVDVINHTLLEDVSFGADGFYYIYPAVMVDQNDNMVMVFSRSGDNEYVGAAYTGRKGTSPPELSGSALLKPGEAHYIKTFGGSRNRWGDYMGIALDPADSNTIWGLVEYADSPENTWGTWIGSFTYQYRVQGVVQDANSGDPLELAHVNVVETGRTIVTDSTGEYAFGSPQPNVTVTASAFAYQDTSLTLTIPPNFPLVVNIPMQPEVEAVISGQVRNPTSGEGIQATLKFFARGNPHPDPWVTVATDSNGNYSVSTIIGTYDIQVLPEIPYPISTVDSVVLDVSGLSLDIDLDPAAVFLVNDDVVPGREIYYQESLNAIGTSYFTWNVATDGIPDSSEYNLFPAPRTVIWFTGDADTNALSDAEQQSLAAFLDNGGRLLLTGQNIAESSSAGVLLTNYLEVGFSGQYNPPILKGVDGDPVGGGLLVRTSGGATNQNSKDVLTVGNTPVVSFNYGPSGTNGIAGIRVENAQDGWKAVFLGFGLEGVENTQGIRDMVIENSLTWLGTPTGIGSEQPLSQTVPHNFQLLQNYPNPFNPTTTIRFTLPVASPVKITIYNTLGEQVRTLVNGKYRAGRHEVVWDGRDDGGNAVSSGIYLYRLSVPGKYRAVKKLLLVK